MKNAIAAITTFSLLILLLGCNNASTTNSVDQNSPKDEQASSSFWVKSSGNRQNILNEGNLSATISLDSLLSIPNLYAIGPIEGLKGEITVSDGDVSIATMEDDAPAFSSATANTNAVFMAYGSCSSWQKVNIDKPLSGLDAIERYVKEQLESGELGTETPLMFRIEGNITTLDYHIIYKMDEAPHNKEEHQKAKQKFKLGSGTVQLVGFWADAAGEGVYTHSGKRTHLHFLSADNASGHVDDIQLKKGATLFLPKVE